MSPCASRNTAGISCSSIGRWSTRRVRAVVAVQVAVVLVLLLGMVALTVDIGFILVSTGQMQSAVDSGALSGASVLPSGAESAIAQATEYAARHTVDGEPVADGPASSLLASVGNWEGLQETFFPLDGTETVSPNAVRVRGERSPMQLYFARVLGVQSTHVRKSAVATLGSGRCVGIWGLEGITGDGNIYTDSYDSREGAYGGSNVHPNGDICSGSDISLSGSAVDIHGDAMWGRGHNLFTDGSPSVWGITGPLCCGVDAPLVDDTALFVNDNASIGLTDRGHDPFGGSPWDLVVTGNDNLTLAGGTYYFTSVVIDGRATLTIAGPTTILVSGPAEFTGNGLINLTEMPENLVIYSTGPTMNLSGTAGFYGVVVAPETDISLVGTGDYYGVLIGRTLDMNGTANIHVDESTVEDIFGVESLSPILVR